VAYETRVKDPADKLDYVINWRAGSKPGLAEDETIATSTWAVYDDKWAVSTAVVMHPELEENDDTTATGWISGGVTGKDYYFTNHIVTDQGRELSWSVKIKIREL
jgi:hypothetical protein